MDTAEDRPACSIKVIRRDGRIETILLKGTWEVVDGSIMPRLRSGCFEHFFTRQGFYDGWGGCVAGLSPEGAEATLRAMEEQRQID